MKFKLATCQDSYTEEDAKLLEKLGFTFKDTRLDFYKVYKDFPKGNKIPYTDFYQKVVDKVDIEINSIEELVELTKIYGKLVISSNHIEIYDS